MISVESRKKELVGDFKNGGREWRTQCEPEPVRVHDFLTPHGGKAIPYGAYYLNRNEGWVSVGIDHDTATFAVRAIRRWWEVMGQPLLPPRDLAAHHRGLRRQQRGEGSALEVGAPAIRRSDRIDAHGGPLSSGDKQVDSD